MADERLPSPDYYYYLERGEMRHLIVSCFSVHRFIACEIFIENKVKNIIFNMLNIKFSVYKCKTAKLLYN